MKASTRCALLLAAALAVAIAVGGCGSGGGVGTEPPPPATVEAFLTDVSGSAVIDTADQGDQVYVQAAVPAGTTDAQAIITVPSGAPAPPEGTTLQLLGGTWTPPANRGRAFTVPSGAAVGTTYRIQVTAQTSGGTLQSDPLTLTVTGGVPCSPVSAWFSGYSTTEREITAAKGATVTVLARPFGTATAVQANIQGTPAPPEGSVIALTTGTWPSPATHGGTFTVPTGAASGTEYDITVIATFSTCQGVSPVITVTVQ
jgi:hypothetical protein